MLPPRVAPIQVVILPITVKNEDENKAMLAYASEIYDRLKKAGIRVELDDRDVREVGISSRITSNYKWTMLT